jgi:hypothetical protein
MPKVAERTRWIQYFPIEYDLIEEHGFLQLVWHIQVRRLSWTLLHGFGPVACMPSPSDNTEHSVSCSPTNKTSWSAPPLQ